jgi:hypothetical protein
MAPRSGRRAYLVQCVRFTCVLPLLHPLSEDIISLGSYITSPVLYVTYVANHPCANQQIMPNSRGNKGQRRRWEGHRCGRSPWDLVKRRHLDSMVNSHVTNSFYLFLPRPCSISLSGMNRYPCHALSTRRSHIFTLSDSDLVRYASWCAPLSPSLPFSSSVSLLSAAMERHYLSFFFPSVKGAPLFSFKEACTGDSLFFLFRKGSKRFREACLMMNITAIFCFCYFIMLFFPLPSAWVGQVFLSLGFVFLYL